MVSSKQPITFIYAIQEGSPSDLLEAVNNYPDDLYSSGIGGSWMHYAASLGLVQHMEVLLGLGMSVDHKSYWNNVKPIESAAEENEFNSVKWLLANGAIPTPNALVAAVSGNSLRSIEFLLNAGADPLASVGTPPRNAYEQSVRLGNIELQRMLAPKNSSFDLSAYLESQYGPLIELALPSLPLNAPFAVKGFDNGKARTVSTFGLSLHEQPSLPYRCELAIRVPRSWPDTQLLGPEVLWPFAYLLDVAASSMETPILQTFHTVGNGEPPQPLGAGVMFCGAIIVPENHELITHDAIGNAIKLFSLQPLFKEELALARKSIEKFVRKMDRSGFDARGVMSLTRKNVGKSLLGF